MACAFREKALFETVIALFSVDSGALLKTLPKPNGPQHLGWTSDNSAILFLKASGGIFNVWLQPANGENARQVTNLDSGTIYAFDAAPDGALILSRGRRSNDVVLASNNK